jgi:quercetin dioxygenase-like cupin family protein
MPQPFVIAPDDVPATPSPMGWEARILATSATTGGAFTVIENVLEPAAGPPVHRHLAEDELIRVMSGRLRVRLEDDLHEVPAGGAFFIPRGAVHVFQNVADEAARLFVVFTPGGMERFFEGAATLPAGPPDTRRLKEIAATAGMEILGPPPSAADPL